MKTLVTGGAGFIGSHIQDKLIELGHKVVVVDNLRSGKKENLNPKAIFQKIDIKNFGTLEKVFAQYKPEVVFHLAAQNEVPYSMNHPREDEEINIHGTLNVLDACIKHGVRKIVYTNTGGAFYGDVPPEKLPINEDEPVMHPTSFYGVSKACGEFYVRLYGNLHKLGWVSLRYSNVYGPRQDGNKEAGVVAIFTTKLVNRQQPTINGSGEHTRDYVYVGDVVEVNIMAMDYNGSDYFNICTGVATSNTEVFETIEDELKTGIEVTHGPERPGDALHVTLDPIKAKEKLGWTAATKFKNGIRFTIEYYQGK